MRYDLVTWLERDSPVEKHLGTFWGGSQNLIASSITTTAISTISDVLRGFICIHEMPLKSRLGCKLPGA